MTVNSPELKNPSARLPGVVALLLALCLTVCGGVLYGKYSQRWGPPADLVAAGKHLEQMPRQIGSWKFVEELPMSDSALEMLECAGHVNRRYLNEETGQAVNLSLIVGPSGPTAVHTPEICFSSRAYELEGERRNVELNSPHGQTDDFWRVDFTTENVLAEGLRIYYAWGLGDGWNASSAPRYEYASSPLLYKLQLAVSLPPTLDEANGDAGLEFLTDLVNSDWQIKPN